MSNRFDRITFDRAIMGGQACLRGMRVPVSLLVSKMAHGASIDEVLADHPMLERADVVQALEYAAAVVRDEVIAG